MPGCLPGHFCLREARRTTASVSPLVFEFKEEVALGKFPFAAASDHRPTRSGNLGAATHEAAAWNDYWRSSRTRMAEGPRMTMKITGRKNMIIGTVSFGGRAAAFLSASCMRESRFS